MAPTANKKAATGKQQTRLNFKNVRKSASASLKPSKPVLVVAAASKATTKTKIDKKQVTRASDVSSIEPDASEPEEASEPEGTEAGFQSVRYIISLLHKSWLILLSIATSDANGAPAIEYQGSKIHEAIWQVEGSAKRLPN